MHKMNLTKFHIHLRFKKKTSQQSRNKTKLLDLINRSTKKPTANIKLNVIWLNTFPQRLGIIQIYALLQLQFAISLEIIIRQMIEIKEISLYVDISSKAARTNIYV
jgi:hypothetical protein